MRLSEGHTYSGRPLDIFRAPPHPPRATAKAMHIERPNQPDMRGFSVIVAACKQTHGIGVGGQLPWSLRGDMQFFKQLTRSTRDPTKRNAVIMGRKTWQSIPTKFRPLDDRIGRRHGSERLLGLNQQLIHLFNKMGRRWRWQRGSGFGLHSWAVLQRGGRLRYRQK